jgi:DNA-binding NarL/FixJ family response regulator
MSWAPARGCLCKNKGTARRTDPSGFSSPTTNTLSRQGIAGLLASYGGLEIIAQVPNDEGALSIAQKEKPDVVLMQVQMPFERFRESLQKLREISPAPKVVLVTMFEEPSYVRELMDLGASAYFLKSASVAHLTGTVRAAVFDPEGHHVVVSIPNR